MTTPQGSAFSFFGDTMSETKSPQCYLDCTLKRTLPVGTSEPLVVTTPNLSLNPYRVLM